MPRRRTSVRWRALVILFFFVLAGISTLAGLDIFGPNNSHSGSGSAPGNVRWDSGCNGGNGSCTLPSQRESRSIRSFAVYYGNVNESVAARLSSFDLVILSPLVDGKYIKEIKRNGTIVLGYVSLATVGGWEPWAGDVERKGKGDIVIGRDEVWNELVVNYSSRDWHDIVLNRALPYISSRGFDGFFFDNLDCVDRYGKKEAMVELIKEARSRFPSAVIYVNRGFSILPEISGSVNGVVFESFLTYYDFNERKYREYTGRDLEWIENVSEKLRRMNLTVLALGYGPHYARDVCKLAASYGFPAYIAEVDLQKIGLRCNASHTTEV